MQTITLLTLFDRISLFHSLKPVFEHKGQVRFRITDSPKFCLEQDKNDVLVMVRYFLKPDVVDIDLLSALRRKYKVIVFFNGNAGGGIHRPEVLPYVDLFFNKTLFADRSLYKKPLYGGELYSHYYHEKFGVVDSDEKIVPGIESDENLAKLRLSWNVGIGEFPRHKYRQRFGVAAARIAGPWAAKLFMRRNRLEAPHNSGEFDINARIGYQSRESIAFQRSLHMEKLKDLPGLLEGKVGQKQFNREIHSSKIIYSPFGWGELCFRDFEAVLSGSLLLKPDMSHLETWPDIFVPGETYVPVDWDGENLREQCLHYLEDEGERRRIAANAYQAFVEQESKLQERFQHCLEEILSMV